MPLSETLDGRRVSSVGVLLLVVGIGGVVAAAAMSKAAYESREPARAASGLKPRPGSGDVPGWISGLYLISALVGIAGLVAIVSG
jgi:hypothetical protein